VTEQPCRADLKESIRVLSRFALPLRSPLTPGALREKESKRMLGREILGAEQACTPCECG
jgi:hypothetical protein